MGYCGAKACLSGTIPHLRKPSKAVKDAFTVLSKEIL